MDGCQVIIVTNRSTKLLLKGIKFLISRANFNISEDGLISLITQFFSISFIFSDDLY